MLDVERHVLRLRRPGIQPAARRRAGLIGDLKDGLFVYELYAGTLPSLRAAPRADGKLRGVWCQAVSTLPLCPRLRVSPSTLPAEHRAVSD